MSSNLRGLSARRGLDKSLYEEIVRASGTSKDENLKAVAGEFMTGQAAVVGAGIKNR
ncbi:MAG: hypothetical protein RBT02_04995 [Bacteroidales bacterium]|nr:hypothetical protein [Bacteroidales bacterium]